MYHKLHIFPAALVITFFVFFDSVLAQPLPGKKDSISSSILNEKRFIQIVLPSDYKAGSTEKYDVIYVLDGDANTGLVDNIAQFFNGEGFMPPVIVVGILNTDRDKDFTPTHSEGSNTSGGAAQFLGFLKNELIPYINKTCPTDGDNIIFGHSLGGLFVTYALFKEPEIFKSYIAADPSYFWDKDMIIRMAASELPKLKNMDRTLFISGRGQLALRDMAILPMDTLLRNATPAGFNWKISSYANETHGSVRLKSIYEGLRFVYDGYGQRDPEFHPMAGIVLKDKPIKIWYFQDTTNVHYTTDGTVPTLASPIMQHALTYSAPGIFTTKVFTGHEKFNKVKAGVFKDNGAPGPVAKAKSFKPGGFHYAYYEGVWDKLPDFTKLKPVKEGLVTKDFDVSKMPAQTHFGLVISGQLEVREDGYYIFALSSDDGSRFYLGNQLLMDNDGVHDASNNKSYILPLKKGFYPIRLEYFQKDYNSRLQFGYITPASINSGHPNPAIIPQELQYSGE